MRAAKCIPCKEEKWTAERNRPKGLTVSAEDRRKACMVAKRILRELVYGKSRLLSGVFFLLYIFICAVWILDFEETAIHTNDLTRDISGTRRSQETNKRSRIFAIPKTLQGYLLYLNVATFHYHGICHI